MGVCMLTAGRVYVDGGNDYLRRGFKEKGDYTEMSVFDEQEGERKQ